MNRLSEPSDCSNALNFTDREMTVIEVLDDVFYLITADGLTQIWLLHPKRCAINLAQNQQADGFAVAH